MVHLKRIDLATKEIANQLYNQHEEIEDQKDMFLRYKRRVYGDNRNPFDHQDVPMATKKSTLNRLEGPDPLTLTNTAGLMALASSMNKSIVEIEKNQRILCTFFLILT